jgi:hypothetical protein
MTAIRSKRSGPSLARLVDQLVSWATKPRRAPYPARARSHRAVDQLLRHQRESEHRAKLRQKRLEAASTARMVREQLQTRERIARRYQRAGFTPAEARQQAERDLVEQDETEAEANEHPWWYL